MFVRLSWCFSWIDFDCEKLEASVPAMTGVLDIIYITVRCKASVRLALSTPSSIIIGTFNDTSFKRGCKEVD